MESRRQQKVSKEIQKEISDIFQKEGVNFYGTSFVTVTNVSITPDLQVARIQISVLNPKELESVIQGLKENKNEIRRIMGNRMRNQLRKIPELEFFGDESLDYVFKMEKIFREIEDKRKEGDKDIEDKND